MLRCMYSGISGMKVNQIKLDVTGNNITNVSTTGFKASRAEFSDMLYQNAGESTAATSTKGGTNAKQVGLGARLSSINKVMGQGNFIATSRSLDCAIDGDGYFMVGKGIQDYGTTGGLSVADNKVTGGDIDVLYTRDGNFTLDSEGNLLTPDGRRVMGYLVTVKDEDKSKIESAGSSISATGEALFVNADAISTTTKKSALTATDTKLQPLKIPDYVRKTKPDANGKVAIATDTSDQQPVKSFSIGSNGLITAQLGDGTTTVLGQIAMASFKNPEGLTDQGGNLANVSANSGPAIIRSGVGADPTKDNSKGYGDVAQGVLEGSNVDLTEQFTDMITATRCFQAASKMISTGDEILQTITGLMR